MDFDGVRLLYGHDQAILAAMIFTVMLGMGAGLTSADFRGVARRPRGLAIGFLSQFGFMPLTAFALASVLNLPPAFAVALILIGCLPGGTTSNMFAYFARASVALSVAMTAASTVAALVMMPLLLNFYTPAFMSRIAGAAETEFVMPTGRIMLSLALVLLPVALGMALRRMRPAWAKTAEDTAGFMAIVILLYLVGAAVVRHGGLFIRTPARIYAGALGVGWIGFLFGHGFARLWKLPPLFRRAVALETGIQNGPLAFAVILLSFDGPERNPMIWLAIIYSTFIVINASLATLYFRKKGRFDWKVCRNTLIHRRLFGASYVTPYPPGFLPEHIARDPGQGMDN